MKNLQQVKEHYTNVINEKEAILWTLKSILIMLESYEVNKTINIWEKGVEKMNKMLGDSVNIYIRKKYDFNDYKSASIYIRNWYKNEEIADFYDCVSNIEDIETNLKSIIEGKEANLNILKEDKKEITKAVKLRDRIEADIKAFKQYNYTLQASLTEGCYNSDFKINI